MRGSLLATVALAGVLTACGGSALDPVAEAAGGTLDAGTSRFAFVAEIRPMDAPSFEMRGNGVLDFVRDRARIVYDMSEVPGVPPDGLMEIRVLDARAYVRPPAGLESEFGLPAGKTWLLVDTSGFLGDSGLFGPMSGTHPEVMLRYFRAASVDVEEVGTRRLRAAETTRYRARLDLERLADQGLDDLRATEAERAAVLRRLGGLEREIGPSIPTTVDVDEQGRLRRLAMEIESDEGGGLMAYEFYDFGVAVDVAPPPLAEIYDSLSG